MKASPSTEGPRNLLVRVHELPLIASIKVSDDFDDYSNEDIDGKFRMLSDRRQRQGESHSDVFADNRSEILQLQSYVSHDSDLPVVLDSDSVYFKNYFYSSNEVEPSTGNV